MSEHEPEYDPYQQSAYPPQNYYAPQNQYPPHGHYPPQYGYQPMPVGNDSKGMGITSMVLGIGSFFVPLIGFLLAIAAVILGFMSRSREPSAQGFAITGLTTGFVSLGLSILAVLLFGGLFLTFFTVGLAS